MYRACNLCEAICGLELRIDGAKIVSIRGDADDPFSRGHICPKGVALIDIHEDPNRLRRPMKRSGHEWTEIAWDEAFDLAAEKLAAIVTKHGNDAVGFYSGNPTVHNAGTLLSIPGLARVLKTKNAFSATSVDQLPQQLVSLLMYGHQFLLPVPDIDRTGYFLIIGGNPVASNGSMMTVPDVTRRLADIRKRGGKVVVIDPRRTETAAVADEHHFIRPATDAALLMAMINTLTITAQPEKVKGLDAALDAIRAMTPERAAKATGIDADSIRRIAREFADAKSAVCYGRVGTTVQAFGTLNQWLIQLLNLVTGNLDRAGGALPTQPLIPLTRAGHYDCWRSRVSGLPESGGELPVAALAEEILTEGEGRIRGVITSCGNPVLSTPDGRRLDEALDSLEFMLSIDIYINETTRHADVILPPASSLHHDHYDLVFNALAVRNVARFNEAIWPRPADERYDWEIFNELCSRLAQRLGREHRPLPSTAAVIASMAGEEQMAAMRNAPHGLDLGPLAPSLFERVDVVDCAPAPLMADVARFFAHVDNFRDGAFTLIGRRHLRSNNSWMHGSHRLIKGKARDQLL
ncbi:MAG TPA: molybdopterin-dependent oxidoreductase, partial [Thermoanaerobaculia bacterium]|nr:molybdopterin-dependent oxidoreductase [Thermoanaerobaculia bacterium]